MRGLGVPWLPGRRHYPSSGNAADGLDGRLAALPRLRLVLTGALQADAGACLERVHAAGLARSLT